MTFILKSSHQYTRDGWNPERKTCGTTNEYTIDEKLETANYILKCLNGQ